MGDVDVLTNSVQAGLRGEKVNPEPLLRFIRAKRGQPWNKIKCAATGLLFTGDRDEAAERWAEVLTHEEANGPRSKEPGCPDTKAGIHALAEVGLVTVGLQPKAPAKLRRLADRQLALTGQRLAMYDLIATPDGDVTGLPGVRSNDPRGPHRTCESAEYREWEGLLHRGPGGGKRPLEKTSPWGDKQAIFAGPAWWWRKASISSLDLCMRLPVALPLALVTYRWDTGTLAYFEDPGEANRREWLTFGSFASKKDPDRTEDLCSSVLVNWKAPGKHEVRAVLSWREEPPVGDVPPGATRVRVPAVGEGGK